MSTFGQILAYGVASVFLGMALTIGFFIFLISRHTTGDGESCFGTLLCLAILGVSGLFFVVAFGI